MQTRVGCLHSSEDEETDVVQTHRTTKQTRQLSRADVNHTSTNKRRNSALESNSSDNGYSESEVTPVKKRSRQSVLVVTSSDDDESEEVTSNENITDHMVDSGIDNTRFEDSKTNTTGDLANMKLGSTDHVSGPDSVASNDICHSASSDAESDDSRVHVSVLRNSRRSDILTDDSDSQLEVTSSSLERAAEGDTLCGSGEEGRRKASERVQTLAERKQHRQSVITAYRLQRMKHLK